MQFLVDFFPLLLFLGAYLKTDDLFFALQILMIAMPISFLIKWKMTGKIDKMLLGSTALLLVMGGATLLFRDPTFLFWKPTALYWIAALVFLGSHYVGEKTIAQKMLQSIGEAPTRVWKTLNISWIAFFAGSGALNLYVAYNYSEAFWVKFKVFGFTAIMLVFLVIQMLWLSRHLTHNNEPD